MATVCLDSQIFYNPTVAAGPEPVSRGPLVRKRNPSAAIFGAPSHPPPSLQDAHDPQHGSAGKSLDKAILIPSDGESDDDVDDGRSDTSFLPPEDSLAVAHGKVEKSCSVGTEGLTLFPMRATRRSIQSPLGLAQTTGLQTSSNG
ncbi:hypothetical protein N658DRAFT_511052 [Parathielavia hyrcaniae]|uniref:Uncharacterized protein n=1 Tax=Parathielavia hyrcaniae TaxID=113614 RepID=A0AAN6PRY4_9PEZI|nr:hypothetical protein N658DRAFT_511052 [Parathielavia hyrcaniae]